jgi:hypothetical protein
VTVYYVGPGGNDNNSGRTWGTRLETLNGAEDKPVVAGDTIYVAPGVYRELLTCDVSGVSGSPITYIGDATGENTDGVGGPVRITGSDNDQTTTRANCIAGGAHDYRTFRGFSMDLSSQYHITSSNGTDWIVEDCTFLHATTGATLIDGNSQSDWVIRRCVFVHGASGSYIMEFQSTGVTNANHLVENCLFLTGSCRGIDIDDTGGITFRNCMWLGSGSSSAIRVTDALPDGYTAITVNNCIFSSCTEGMRAQVLGEIVENYNAFYGNATDRINVNVGANSNAYPALWDMPLLNAGTTLVNGFRLPWWFGSLSRWSQVGQITGTNEPAEDMFASRRPYTHGGPIASLCSWGPVQWMNFLRSETRSYDGSVSALVREGSATWMFVPGVTATSTTISVRNWRTAGYGGHRNPGMVIKQPGQPDRTTISGGAAGAWNQISDTFTPAAEPPWLTVEMRNFCDFTTTTTVSTTSTTTVSTTSTTTVTVSTLTTTTTTLACDVWFDALRVT